MKKIIVEFSFEDILTDIISHKEGDCYVSDRAEYWLDKIKKGSKIK